jgi:hypothetical protein
MQKCQQRVVKLGNIKKGISDEQLRYILIYAHTRSTLFNTTWIINTALLLLAWRA